ncbi:MAG: TonB-dependent receptor [Pseudoxanthomonas sp.]
MKRNKLFCAQRRVLQGMLIGGAMLSLGAQAQEAATEQKDSDAQTSATNKKIAELDSVMVTAQRRSERLQDVPISITAIGSEELALRNVNDLKSLTATVPGLLIPSPGGPTGTSQIALRGVSGLLPTAGTSQGVPIYLDGIFLSRPESGLFALDDVERIEVLRGPQGTLYGRNSTGGAINIITREPGEEVHGGFDLSLGNYAAKNFKGSLSGPLGGGFSAGISTAISNHDGYFTNEATGHDLEGRDTYTIRGKLRYASSEDAFTALLSADQSRSNSSTVYQNLYRTTGYVGLGDPYVVQIDPATESRLHMDSRSKGVGLTMTYTPSEHVSFTSVTGWREFNSRSLFDLDSTNGNVGGPLGLVSKGKNDVETFNTELRSTLTYDRFRATIGATYYSEDQTIALGSENSVLVLPYNFPLSTSELKAMAVFAQAEYDLAEQFTLVGGLRWNREDRNYVVDYTGRGAPAPLDGNVKDTALIPSAGINYKLSPDVLFYLKYSNGYLAPGYNVSAGPGNPVGTFGAENLDTYELGVKSQFLDRRLTFNAAAFHTRYEDVQVRVTVAAGIGQVLNAAQATINGVETSLSYATGTGLTLSGHLTWMDATYDEFCEAAVGNTYYQANDPLCSPGVIDRSGNRLNQSPEWQGGVSLGYYRAVGDRNSLQFNLSYNTTSNVYFAPANVDAFSSGRMERLDARVGLQLGDGPEVYVYANNLTDAWNTDYMIGSSAPLILHHVSDPRTYGLGVRYRF